MSNFNENKIADEVIKQIKANGPINPLMEAIRSAAASTMGIRVVADTLSKGMSDQKLAGMFGVTAMLAPICISIVALSDKGANQKAVEELAESICQSLLTNIKIMHKEREAGDEHVTGMIERAINDAAEAAGLFLSGGNPEVTH